MVAAARDGQGPEIRQDERLGECRYGDWTGKPLRKLAKEPLWRVVQAHPSAVRFPGPDGESMLDTQHRAVAAVREWNAALGPKATYLICSHGDVIKGIVADCLGLHLDLSQRIQADPCSLTVIRYTPLRPFLVRMNDTGGGVEDLMPRPPETKGHGAGKGLRDESDAVVGGGAGAGPASGPERGPDRGTCRSRTISGRARIGNMPVYMYDPPERFVAGSVGQPGERTFYLQAMSRGRVTSVSLEKFQVSLLAERLDELLDEVLRRTGGSPEVPAAPPVSLQDDGPLDMPVMEDFRVGAIALAWDGEDGRVVIEAQEASEEPVEPLAEEVPADGPGVLRVRITPGAARAFAQRALRIVAAGRPPCPLCGLPLNADGHICPRQNGHRAGA